ncbi:hypothetical protein BpHYR1_048399 [Brachionus plicatilis]|uniref:Uncharacterized protein n=1 Tax=Brachionus plicatilis TaxID=10195 RepID=A0A3M7P2Q6_BRAPC|nr:hypothetical protein BpHYR1_048399 [Brachionus plicatilis]
MIYIIKNSNINLLTSNYDFYEYDYLCDFVFYETYKKFQPELRFTNSCSYGKFGYGTELIALILLCEGLFYGHNYDEVYN